MAKLFTDQLVFVGFILNEDVLHYLIIFYFIGRYGNKSFIDERHRHRYEVCGIEKFRIFLVMNYLITQNTINLMQVNPDMIATFENAGLSFIGKDETGRRMEV